MIITDLSQETPLNKAVNLKDIAVHAGIAKCYSIIATGTFTGTPKLTISHDGTNFYPLYNNDGEQIELEASKALFLNFANVYLKVDLTGVTSEDLKVSIQ
ncbi:MAG: hypothetical protein J5594_03215 [Elusimicrobiaceae bacterium]|nr:hypothetical protein [Elusimicrobiaceae bacterium]